MKKTSLLSISALGLLTIGCGSTALVSTPIENIDAVPNKVVELTEDELKEWFHKDLIKDTIPGMSVDKAYSEIIQNKKGKTVIVAVLDSGIDINHEDLKDVIWVNDKEVPNNGKDDDKNGFVDDVNGWNFLGPTTDETLEMVRIIQNGDTSYPGFEKIKEEQQKKYNEALQSKQRYEQIYQGLTDAHALATKELGTDSYTKEDLSKIDATGEATKQAVGMLTQFFNYGDIPDMIEEIKGGIEHFSDQLNYNYNLDFDGREALGDDPDDYSTKFYGDNDVITNLEDTLHGTHVAGIIGAVRDNGIGMNGVANNVEIMPVRTVPNGDEYDKDVALAIRYAVDNGAKVINTSFGKGYSPHPDWVWDAIKYAASKDVLIVNAAGNDSNDLNIEDTFPTDAKDGKEVADNFLTVGALNFEYSGNLVANFSNYGKNDVDVFAPGVKIWSTIQDSEYKFLQGTSMASPAVAGVAALIRSYYPKLSASQVKKILMQSGLSVNKTVQVGGRNGTSKPFNEISTTGKIVNAYNALILADKVSRKKVTL